MKIVSVSVIRGSPRGMMTAGPLHPSIVIDDYSKPRLSLMPAAASQHNASTLQTRQPLQLNCAATGACVQVHCIVVRQ